MFQTYVIPPIVRLVAYLLTLAWAAVNKGTVIYCNSIGAKTPPQIVGSNAVWEWASIGLLGIAAGHVPTYRSKAASPSMSNNTSPTS